MARKRSRDSVGAHLLVDCFVNLAVVHDEVELRFARAQTSELIGFLTHLLRRKSAARGLAFDRKRRRAPSTAEAERVGV